MSKKNPLSIWSYPYKKTYYLTHPWKWWHDTYWNIRNWIHRANKGFAYTDVWNFCDWYPRVGAEALRYLARHNCGYPGVEPGETMETWRAHLNYLADRLDKCADSQDFLFVHEQNEYEKEYDEIMEKRRETHENPDGSVTVSYTLTPEEEEIRNKYYSREKEIYETNLQYNKETYRMIAEELGHLWD